MLYIHVCLYMFVSSNDKSIILKTWKLKDINFWLRPHFNHHPCPRRTDPDDEVNSWELNKVNWSPWTTKCLLDNNGE